MRTQNSLASPSGFFVWSHRTAPITGLFCKVQTQALGWFCPVTAAHQHLSFTKALLGRTEKLILKSKSNNAAMHRHTQASRFSLSFSFCQKIPHFCISEKKQTQISIMSWKRRPIICHTELIKVSRDLPGQGCAIDADPIMKFLLDEFIPWMKLVTEPVFVSQWVEQDALYQLWGRNHEKECYYIILKISHTRDALY